MSSKFLRSFLFLIALGLVLSDFDANARGGGGGSGGSRSRSYSYGSPNTGSGGYRRRYRRYRNCYLISDPEVRSNCESQDRLQVVFGFIIIVLALFRNNFFRRRPNNQLLPDSEIERKATATETLFQTLGQKDRRFNFRQAHEFARHAFLTLQNAWTRRDYSAMRPLVFDGLRVNHELQIANMIRRNEINQIEDLTITNLRIVHLISNATQNHFEFTALIGATARDYYLEAQTGDYLRGDRNPVPFQEYWTFQHSNGAWLLREILQISDRRFISEANLVEGEAKPQAIPSTGKLSNLIRAYALKNPIWDETHLNLLGRTVSIAYFKTLESGDPKLLQGFITETFEEKLRQALTLQSRMGSPRFENLFCTGVEITYARESPACLVIRANMRAQRFTQLASGQPASVAPMIPFAGHFTYRFSPSQKKFLLDAVEVPKFA